MRAGKGNQEDDEYEEEEFGSKKEGPSSANNSNSTNKGSPFACFYTLLTWALDPVIGYLFSLRIISPCCYFLFFKLIIFLFSFPVILNHVAISAWQVLVIGWHSYHLSGCVSKKVCLQWAILRCELLVSDCIVHGDISLRWFPELNYWFRTMNFYHKKCWVDFVSTFTLSLERKGGKESKERT